MVKHFMSFVAAGAALLALGGVHSSAQAQTPDFTCPSANVCGFVGAEFTGRHFSAPTKINSNIWFIDAFFGSMNDNSGSIVWVAFINSTTGAFIREVCYEPGKWSNLPAGAAAIYIEYGVGSCAFGGHKPNPP